MSQLRQPQQYTQQNAVATQGLKSSAVRFLAASRKNAGRPDASAVRAIAFFAKEHSPNHGTPAMSFVAEGIAFVRSGTIMLSGSSVPAYRIVRGECTRCGGKFLSEAEIPIGRKYPESETLLAIGRAITGDAVCPSPGCKACASGNAKHAAR